MVSHEEIIEKLKKHIAGFSGWSDDEKKRWHSRVELLSPEGALFLRELFEESPEDVRALHENIEEKERILKTKDGEAWNRLLTKEKEELASRLKEG